MSTTRNVTPQWAGKDSKNLGERELPTKELTFARIASERDPKKQAAIENLLNGQLSIRMGPYIIGKLARPAKLEDEKQEAYAMRVHPDMVKAFAAFNETVDFEELLASIAENGGKSRGGDPMVKYIRAKWETATPEKRTAFIAKHALADVDATSTEDEVVAAWDAAQEL